MQHDRPTESEEDAVKLKRPFVRRPCCISSDVMVRLSLLSWRACSAANNAVMSASSSFCEVGGHQPGIALKHRPRQIEQQLRVPFLGLVHISARFDRFDLPQQRLDAQSFQPLLA